MSLPDTIAQEIQQQPADVRAEVIVDQLLQAGLSRAAVMVHTNRFFFRRFSRDVFGAATDEGSRLGNTVHIYTSRAGLYDILPEGLFFQPAQAGGRKTQLAAEMAEEYRENKKQELEIRKFFSPLENEFFFHRHKNFAEEKKLLTGLNNEMLNRYFIQFWNLAADMPAAMALRMTLLLPYVHQVAGNTQLMAASLQTILDEKVSCKLVFVTAQSPGLYCNVLGSYSLGNDLVCGDYYREEEGCFAFTLHRLQQSSAQDYLPGGKLYETLQSFYRFFVPVNAVVKTILQLVESKEHMRIGNMEEATLGIATVI